MTDLWDKQEWEKRFGRLKERSLDFEKRSSLTLSVHQVRLIEDGTYFLEKVSRMSLEKALPDLLWHYVIWAETWFDEVEKLDKEDNTIQMNIPLNTREQGAISHER